MASLAGVLRLAQADERQDGDDDDHEANEINDRVHVSSEGLRRQGNGRIGTRLHGAIKYPFGDGRNVGNARYRRLGLPSKESQQTTDLNTLKDGLIVTAFWEARPEEVPALVDLIRRFPPQAQREPGVKAFQIHQSTSDPTRFFFYEVFRDEAAFAEQQQREHFKTLIVEQALPKLAKRERTQHRFV